MKYRKKTTKMMMESTFTNVIGNGFAVTRPSRQREIEIEAIWIGDIRVSTIHGGVSEYVNRGC